MNTPVPAGVSDCRQRVLCRTYALVVVAVARLGSSDSSWFALGLSSRGECEAIGVWPRLSAELPRHVDEDLRARGLERATFVLVDRDLLHQRPDLTGRRQGLLVKALPLLREVNRRVGHTAAPMGGTVAGGSVVERVVHALGSIERAISVSTRSGTGQSRRLEARCVNRSAYRTTRRRPVQHRV